jgi:hypothetical protein
VDNGTGWREANEDRGPEGDEPEDDAPYDGVLVYLKASLTGDEPSDVLNYRSQHASFPHQTTVDQFFVESQFESYRALGFHIAQEVIGHVSRRLDRTNGTTDRRARLFGELRDRWFPPPPEFDRNFLESAKEYMVVQQEALRSDKNLQAFSLAMYPDLEREAGDQEFFDKEAAERHAVAQMLQVMEKAWLLLHLDNHYRHPLNSGWRNLFKSWTTTETFKKNWTVLANEFSRSFVHFCVNELNLPDPLDNHHRGG